MNKEQLNKIDEEFASIIHDVWSKWQEYLHSKCEIQETKVSFPKTLFERWERQISTSYNLLPENEKQSDRDVFEEYYKNFLHSKLQEAYELGRRDEEAKTATELHIITQLLEAFMICEACCHAKINQQDGEVKCAVKKVLLNKIKSLQTNKE